MFKWCTTLLVVLGHQPTQIIFVFPDDDCSLHLMTVPLVSMMTTTESGSRAISMWIQPCLQTHWNLSPFMSINYENISLHNNCLCSFPALGTSPWTEGGSGFVFKNHYSLSGF